MDLLQYSFTLDPKHPMDAVRERVALRKHLLAGVPGLHWKAWLLSEPLAERDQPKTYAPLYLFDSPRATLAFLCSEIYRGVTDHFGWTQPLCGQAVHTPLVSIARAQSCTVRSIPLPDHAALCSAASNHMLPAGALLVARQLDLARMRLRTYTFWASSPEQVSRLQRHTTDLVCEVVAVTAAEPVAA